MFTPLVAKMTNNNNKIHTAYHLADGTRIPSVTTYLSILGKDAIIHWAWEQGVAGLDYRKVRDQAGSTGTIVHQLILDELRGTEPDLSQWSEQDLATTVSPMRKWHSWKEKHELEPILLETPLISETYRFGGTPDFFGLVDGCPTLLDFKTGRGIYDEAFSQVAAYKVLIEEPRPNDPDFPDYGFVVESARILRIGKSESEGFEEREVGDLTHYWNIFLACQKIYEERRLIKQEGKH